MVEGDGRKGRCGVLERVTNKASEFGGRRCVPVEEGAQGGLVRCTLIAAGGDMLLLGDYFPLLYSCLFLWESFVGEGEEIDRLTMEHPSFTCGGGVQLWVGDGYFGLGQGWKIIFQRISPSEAIAVTKVHLFLV